MIPLTLFTGGARSGKSRLAVEAAQSSARPVVFIATAEAGDAEFAQRIERHRAERPTDWTVVEEPLRLEQALLATPADACVVIDCLSLWVANLLEAEGATRTLGAARATAAVAASRPAPTFAVTNEVGLGIVPANPLAREYRDVLGRANAIWAEAAHQAFLVVAGRVLRLHRAPGLIAG